MHNFTAHDQFGFDGINDGGKTPGWSAMNGGKTPAVGYERGSNATLLMVVRRYQAPFW